MNSDAESVGSMARPERFELPNIWFGPLPRYPFAEIPLEKCPSMTMGLSCLHESWERTRGRARLPDPGNDLPSDSTQSLDWLSHFKGPR